MQKFKIFSILLVLLNLGFKAQQIPLFNTYSYDLMQLNIAAVGRTCIEANLNYRSQWAGIKDAPKLYQLNASMALGNANGVGIKVFQQQFGQLKLTNITGAYAYRAQLNKTSKLHLGIGASYNQNKFDVTKVSVVDAEDPTLSRASQQRSNNFDCEAGALFLSEKITAGISASHIYNTNQDFQSVSLKLKPEINFVGSYKVYEKKNISVEPWLVNRYTLGGSNKLEGMVNVKFLQLYTVGVGYRLNYGIMAIAGFELGKLKIAYSFDYAVGKNLGSANQILLGIDLCKKKKQFIPDSSAVEPQKIVETPTIQSVMPIEEKKADVQEKTINTATLEPIKENPIEQPKMEAIQIKEQSIEGVLSADNNVSMKNKVVKLLTEDGQVVETTTTNNYGAFVFKHIAADKNYVVSIDDSEIDTKPGTVVRLKNIKGKEIKTWVKGEEKVNYKIISGDNSTIKDLQADDESLKMQVKGKLLDENNQPLKFARLTVKESDGSNPQSLLSDKDGNFIFKNLDAEKSYIFETDENDKSYSGLNIIKIANQQGKTVKTLNVADKKFSFNLLEAEKSELSEYQVEDLLEETNLKRSKSEEKKVDLIETKQMVTKEKLIVGNSYIVKEANLIAEKIVFEKRSSRLSEENIEALKKIAKIINEKTGPVTIVGFASNDGKFDFNLALAEERAQLVRGTLISLGVNPNRLLVKNGGPTKVLNDHLEANRTIRFE